MHTNNASGNLVANHSQKYLGYFGAVGFVQRYPMLTVKIDYIPIGSNKLALLAPYRCPKCEFIE